MCLNYENYRYNPNAAKDFKAKLYLSHPDKDLDRKIEKLIRRSTS